MNTGFKINTVVKAQISAFIGGVCDYVIMMGCMEWFHINLVSSIIISNLLGALINFSINRHWTYNANNMPVGNQLIKFYFVLGGSIFLKSYGTYFCTEFFVIDYRITRLLVDLIVSLGWNFMLQRYWVFRKDEVYQTE